MLWFSMVLWCAYYGRDASTLIHLSVYAGALLLAGLWLAAGVFTLLTRGRMGASGWLSLPLVFLVALLPWPSWLSPIRLRHAEPALRAFAEANAWIPEGQPREVNSTVGGVSVSEVERYRGAVLLRFHRSPDGEAGLAYCPGGAMPDPPEWARSANATPVSDGWYSYSWYDE